MNTIARIVVWVLFVVAPVFADQTMPFVDTQDGKLDTGEAILIILSEEAGQRAYGVVARGDAGDLHVYLAAVPNELSVEKHLGKPSVITARAISGGPTRKYFEITKIDAPVLKRVAVPSAPANGASPRR